jgi:hypothetical protein
MTGGGLRNLAVAILTSVWDAVVLQWKLLCVYYIEAIAYTVGAFCIGAAYVFAWNMFNFFWVTVLPWVFSSLLLFWLVAFAVLQARLAVQDFWSIVDPPSGRDYESAHAPGLFTPTPRQAPTGGLFTPTPRTASPEMSRYKSWARPSVPVTQSPVKTPETFTKSFNTFSPNVPSFTSSPLKPSAPVEQLKKPPAAPLFGVMDLVFYTRNQERNIKVRILDILPHGDGKVEYCFERVHDGSTKYTFQEYLSAVSSPAINVPAPLYKTGATVVFTGVKKWPVQATVMGSFHLSEMDGFRYTVKLANGSRHEETASKLHALPNSHVVPRFAHGDTVICTKKSTGVTFRGKVVQAECSPEEPSYTIIKDCGGESNMLESSLRAQW